MSEDNQNLVQYIIEHWRQFDASLDTSGTEIIGRIVRLSSIVSNYVDKNLKEYDLTIGEFDVLAALARENDNQLTPKQLQYFTLISSGGMTNRIDRLEKKELIVRIPNKDDRRSLLIKLTPKALALVKEIIPTHLSIERQFIQGLNELEIEQLKILLIKIMNPVES